jgi:hypothetical protein
MVRYKPSALSVTAVSDRENLLVMLQPNGRGDLMRKGRSCSELGASLLFDPDELRGAHLLAKKKMLATPPTVNQVVQLFEQLGGFLARRRDGEPGAKTIWRRLDPVRAAAHTLRALRERLG